MKRPHPLTVASVLTGAFLFAVLPLVLALLLAVGGCGSSSGESAHADYLRFVATAKWEQREVLYRVHGGPPVGASVVRSTVKRGLGRWETSIQDYIRLREAQGNEQENITIRFVKVGSLGGSFLGSQTLGRTTAKYLPGHRFFESVLIELDSQLWGRLQTLEVIASHEIGCHGLGIRGHSPFPSDVCSANPTTSRPTGADARTFRLIYGGIE